jgi:hypothetical protein
VADWLPIVRTFGIVAMTNAAYYLTFTYAVPPEATIDFLSFATGNMTRVITLDRHAGHGSDLSADGRTLLFGQMDSYTEDLMLVENFR